MTLITGGFLKGYKTYILAGVGALSALAGWAVGDQSGTDTMRTVWEMFLSISVGTARASLK